LKIQRFTSEVAKVINLIPSDVGRPLAHTVSKLVGDDLVADAGRVLETLEPLEKELETKEGAWYLARVMPYRALHDEITGVVITFTDVTAIKRLSRQQAAKEYAESIVDTVREPLVVLDESLRVTSANRAFYAAFGVSPRETEGKLLLELGSGQWDIPELKQLLEGVATRDETMRDFRVEYEFPSIGHRVMLINGRRIIRDDKPHQILLAIEDITDSRPERTKGRRKGRGA
jgi:two-component system, chemotaxis family, CheB/CheR fusion protein